ncbi:MAG: siderophore ABC transporter substrate-binding protein, partial [Sphingobacterium sp.]
LRKTLIGLVIALAMIGCQSGTKKQGPTDSAGDDQIRIEHKLGESLVNENPDRVVTLDIGALETLKELGVKPVGIPKQHLPDYLMNLRDDPDMSDVGSVIEPNIEAIAALGPDLILISTRQERHYQELSKIAPTVFIGTDNKNYLASFEDNTLMLGSIFSKTALTQKKLDSLHAKIDKARKKFESLPTKGLFLIYNNGRFNAYGKGSRFGFVHDVLGIKPVLDLNDESVHGQRISNELIAEANPDYLFIVDRNAAVTGQKASHEEIENKLIQQTSAYRNEQVFYLNPDVWFISGGGLTSVELMVDDIVELIN